MMQKHFNKKLLGSVKGDLMSKHPVIAVHTEQSQSVGGGFGRWRSGSTTKRRAYIRELSEHYNDEEKTAQNNAYLKLKFGLKLIEDLDLQKSVSIKNDGAFEISDRDLAEVDINDPEIQKQILSKVEQIWSLQESIKFVQKQERMKGSFNTTLLKSVEGALRAALSSQESSARVRTLSENYNDEATTEKNNAYLKLKFGLKLIEDPDLQESVSIKDDGSFEISDRDLAEVDINDPEIQKEILSKDKQYRSLQRSYSLRERIMVVQAQERIKEPLNTQLLESVEGVLGAELSSQESSAVKSNARVRTLSKNYNDKVTTEKNNAYLKLKFGLALIEDLYFQEYVSIKEDGAFKISKVNLAGMDLAEVDINDPEIQKQILSKVERYGSLMIAQLVFIIESDKAYEKKDLPSKKDSKNIIDLRGQAAQIINCSNNPFFLAIDNLRQSFPEDPMEVIGPIDGIDPMDVVSEFFEHASVYHLITGEKLPFIDKDMNAITPQQRENVARLLKRKINRVKRFCKDKKTKQMAEGLIEVLYKHQLRVTDHDYHERVERAEGGVKQSLAFFTYDRGAKQQGNKPQEKIDDTGP